MQQLAPVLAIRMHLCHFPAFCLEREPLISPHENGTAEVIGMTKALLLQLLHEFRRPEANRAIRHNQTVFLQLFRRKGNHRQCARQMAHPVFDNRTDIYQERWRLLIKHPLQLVDIQMPDSWIILLKRIIHRLPVQTAEKQRPAKTSKQQYSGQSITIRKFFFSIQIMSYRCLHVKIEYPGSTIKDTAYNARMRSLAYTPGNLLTNTGIIFFAQCPRILSPPDHNEFFLAFSAATFASVFSSWLF